MNGTESHPLTLEKALTDAFILVLQQEMRGALNVTAVENFDDMVLPACFVKCTRQKESIINSAIYQFSVELALVVQADDFDPHAMENLWASLLSIAYDNEGLKSKLNSISPLYAFVFGILRDGSVTLSHSDRHFVRSIAFTIHCGLMG